MRRILIVDDETHIAELLVMNLRQQGYETITSTDGPGAVDAALRRMPDLILLDIMLPGMSGLEVCRTLKADKRTRHIPVIMLTAKSEENDKVIGLGIGADDYITKPFGLRELSARIEAALRRSTFISRPPESSPLKQGNLFLDIDGHELRLGGRAVDLSPTEFAVFAELVKHSGKLVRREDLLYSAGITNSGDSSRSLDVHIRNVRRKLGSEDHSISIQAVRGLGYRMNCSDGPFN